MSTAPRPVLELLSFLASDDFKKDASLTHPTFELIEGWRGLQRVYEGVSVDDEDPNRRWLILIWETFEDHKSLMDDQAVYPKVLENLGKCLGGDVEMRHVQFGDTTATALSSPVVEIAKLELKLGANKDEFESHMRDFMEHAKGAPRSKEHAPFTFGQTRESESSYFFMGGWDSKQAHLDCVADPEGIQSFVHKIGNYATFKVFHFTVKEFGFRNKSAY
ncbi:hypothetical protein NP233_g11648 [Leucocoprinus birnbaumii]|uniref:Uncharacterized protein n=1 Tax=Leucocoprinus birnbaumii TaxID=56174 RepID=A0AAD5VGD8_9AGAR|nr:hypothetical protein NP233_g11648 [Leucocoprinus birnbaumii]